MPLASVMRVPVQADGSAGAVEIFADGSTLNAAQKTTHALDGADGIAFDVQGNLYVCANQANEIQVLSPSGKLVTRYAGTGAAALDFPASLVFKGRSLFITNLSLFDGGISLAQGPFASMSAQLRKSIFRVQVLDVELRMPVPLDDLVGAGERVLSAFGESVKAHHKG